MRKKNYIESLYLVKGIKKKISESNIYNLSFCASSCMLIFDVCSLSNWAPWRLCCSSDATTCCIACSLRVVSTCFHSWSLFMILTNRERFYSCQGYIIFVLIVYTEWISLMCMNIYLQTNLIPVKSLNIFLSNTACYNEMAYHL